MKTNNCPRFFKRWCYKQEAEENVVKIIGRPYDLNHCLSVTYNYNLARYEVFDNNNSLENFNFSQFGVPISSVPRIKLPQYNERIPAILCLLTKTFIASGGLSRPYVFRESPSKEKRDMTLVELNNGSFDTKSTSHDVLVLADLIKLWFRSLPAPLLRIDKSSAEYGTLLFILDFILLVCDNKQRTCMTLESLAIVFAPNLYWSDGEDDILRETKDGIRITTDLLLERRRCSK